MLHDAFTLGLSCVGWKSVWRQTFYSTHRDGSTPISVLDKSGSRPAIVAGSLPDDPNRRRARAMRLQDVRHRRTTGRTPGAALRWAAGCNAALHAREHRGRAVPPTANAEQPEAWKTEDGRCPVSAAALTPAISFWSKRSTSPRSSFSSSSRFALRSSSSRAPYWSKLTSWNKRSVQP